MSNKKYAAEISNGRPLARQMDCFEGAVEVNYALDFGYAVLLERLLCGEERLLRGKYIEIVG